MNTPLILPLLTLALLTPAQGLPAELPPSPATIPPAAVSALPSSPEVYRVHAHLQRTVNFGNALEAPSEGSWGLTLEEGYFGMIQKAGFTAVRLPVRFSGHAGERAPYSLERALLLRVDWAIQNAKKRGLAVVLDYHHDDLLMQKPAQGKARWLAIWKQLAERYRNQPETVVFELLNEPHDKLEPLWNRYFAEALAVVRQTNPTRAVVVGPIGWNNAEHLGKLTLPADPNLIVTFHNYTPFNFTHQGAEWWEDGSKYLGLAWKNSPTEQKVVRDHIALAANYGKQFGRPVFMGEFGAYGKAEIGSRERWTAFTRKTAEASGMAWGYWEFGAGFGVYDRLMKEWRPGLLEALMKR